MHRRIIESFGILLLLTGAAKIISVGGAARILDTSDPVFLISFRYLFYIAASAELSVAAVCLFGKDPKLQSCLTAILATNFLLYRVGLHWQGYGSTCHCLGTLTDALHITPQTADTVMKVILAYLLIGSYTILFWLWRQRKKTPAFLPA